MPKKSRRRRKTKVTRIDLDLVSLINQVKKEGRRLGVKLNSQEASRIVARRVK